MGNFFHYQNQKMSIYVHFSILPKILLFILNYYYYSQILQSLMYFRRKNVET